MAEIEFKRRGTPVWAVVLVLLVIAVVLYFVFGRHTGAPATQAADTSSTAPAAAPAPGAASGSTGAAATSPAAPAAAVTGIGRFAAWVDSAKMPSDAASQAEYLGAGLSSLADALKERAPQAGAQYVLVRALADTVRMPNRTPKDQVNSVQAAFFATSYALRDYTGGQKLGVSASSIQLTKGLGDQKTEIQKFFKSARDVMRNPGAPVPPAPAPAAKTPA
jgi:hypothetical protein